MCTGLALESCYLSEQLRKAGTVGNTERDRWKHNIAAASLAGLLRQSEAQQAVEQLLGGGAPQNRGRGDQWKTQVLEALSAYKVCFHQPDSLLANTMLW